MTPAALATGRYRIEEELGRGGMAAVYRAVDGRLGRTVAIKLLAEHLAGDEDFRRRFVREAKVAASLSHPGIVRVYDTGEDGGRPFIVMEYVDGETLAQALERRGRLPLDEVVGIGRQLAEVLAYAHAAGVVHRDVKPGNVLLRRDGAVKLADLGIARAVEATQLTEIGSVLGSAGYLAPEQAAGERVGPPADVYALGVVLYELASGTLPREGRSLADLVAGRGQQPLPLRAALPDVPAELESLVTACLSPAAGDRPGAAELAGALEALEREPPTRVAAADAAPTIVAAPRLPRPGGRAVAVLGAALLLVALVGFLVFEPGRSTPADRAAPPPSAEYRDLPPAEQARSLAAWLRAQAR